MEKPQNMSYEQIVSELDGLSGSELHGDRATALATERIKQIDEMMDLPTFKGRNEQELNNQKRISEEERNNGRELMKILHTEPSILLKQSESYHHRMKEDFDRGYFNDDIEFIDVGGGFFSKMNDKFFITIINYVALSFGIIAFFMSI